MLRQWRPEDRGRGTSIWLWLAAMFMVAAAAALGCYSASPPPATPTPSLWPLAAGVGQITASFRPQASRPHFGLDLAAPHGTPVLAVADGIVVSTVRKPRYGRLVVLKHANAVETRYAHLRRFSVREGERVTAGQVIGAVGQSGNATGPHLHYEVRIEGVPVNPERYLPTTR